MKKFHLLKKNNEFVEFHSKTARDAALKAASRDETLIVLLENDKFYIYKGAKRSLSEQECTEFTRQNKIFHKPIAKKMHYGKFERVVDVKKEDDVEFVKENLRNILGDHFE